MGGRIRYNGLGGLEKEAREEKNGQAWEDWSVREFSYDSLGNRTWVGEWKDSVVPEQREVLLAFDPLGRLRKRTEKPDDGSGGRTWETIYDDEERSETQRDPYFDENSPVLKQTVTIRDQGGRVVTRRILGYSGGRPSGGPTPTPRTTSSSSGRTGTTPSWASTTTKGTGA